MQNDDKELVDYYDPEGNVIGFCSRTEADAKNYTYPNAIIFVFSPDGNAWIQKRSINKKHYPGLWDPTACGAIAHDEDPKLAAERELEEEMQLHCNLQFVEKFLNVFPGEGDQKTRSRMSYIYVGVSSETPKSNHEVEAIAEFDTSELLEKARSNPGDFVPSFEVEYMKALSGYKLLVKN
jgi:isopentenyldiphosphate isomerase